MFWKEPAGPSHAGATDTSTDIPESWEARDEGEEEEEKGVPADDGCGGVDTAGKSEESV